LFGFVTKHSCDGQTDGQTELPQLIGLRASLAARAVKMKISEVMISHIFDFPTDFCTGLATTQRSWAAPL